MINPDQISVGINHNFFKIDIKIIFPFEVKGTGPGLGTLVVINGKELNYLQTLKDNESVQIPILLGYGMM